MATFIPSTVLGRDGATSANERIAVGVIGCGDRGIEDLRLFQQFPEVRILGVCDPVQERRDQAKLLAQHKNLGLECTTFNDFRELLEQDPLDAVIIATPDHWHHQMTLAACLRGRDIFCESPETLTVHQGQEMVKNVRLYSRIFSGGANRILDDYGNLVRLVISGAIGDLKEVHLRGGVPPVDCYLPAEAVPEGVDWNLWLGPAPRRPFHANLLNGDFRLYRDYSGGTFAELGAHLFGAALFAMNQQRYQNQLFQYERHQQELSEQKFEDALPQQRPQFRRSFERIDIIPPDGKDIEYLTYRFNNDVVFHHSPVPKEPNKKEPRLRFLGTDGELPGERHRLVNRFVDIPWYGGVEHDNGSHPRSKLVGDFLECLRTRKKPFRDVESVHETAVLCHLGNIAQILGRSLIWNAVEEKFIADELANRRLRRPERIVAQ